MAEPVIILKNKPQISRYGLVMMIAAVIFVVIGIFFTNLAWYFLAGVLGLFGILLLNIEEYLYAEVDTDKKQITLVSYKKRSTVTRTFPLNNTKIKYWLRSAPKGKVYWVLDLHNDDPHEELRITQNTMAGMDSTHLKKIYDLVKPLGTDISPKDKTPRLF